MARVLIVDDSPEFRNSIGAHLQKTGHEVAFAANGKEALEHLKQNAVDLVLLDYQMPIWDGVESMVLFRSENVKNPVIAYTCQSLDYSTPFEAVMESLGTIAAVRCGNNPEALLKKVEQYFAPAKSGSRGKSALQVPQIPWEKVRMLNIEPLAISVLLKDQSEPTRFAFESRDEMEEVLAQWFRSRPVLK